jgi:hypothetical protein
MAIILYLYATTFSGDDPGPNGHIEFTPGNRFYPDIIALREKKVR